MGRKIKRRRDGSYDIRIDDGYRDILRWLLPQVREVVEDESALSKRLFPTAHPNDVDLEAEYQDMARSDLRSSRLAAFDAIESSLAADRLSEEQMAAWIRSINDVRLVLGTRLDLSEETTLDDYDRDSPEFSLYWGYSVLSELLWELVEATE